MRSGRSRASVALWRWCSTGASSRPPRWEWWSVIPIVVVSIVLGLAGLVGVEWMLSIRDEGPYPFADVPKGGLIAYSALEGVRLVRSEGGTSWLVRAVTRNPVD